MEIVIVGDGKVGYILTQELSQEGHDVTVIDKNSQVISDTAAMLDVRCIRGNGASLQAQRDAGVPEADLLIAVTSTDELNMLCCLLARKLGAKHTIARIRNPEYSEQLYLLKNDLGLSMSINPELECAREIARMVKFSSAIRLDTFANGKVDLVEYKLDADSPIVGRKLSMLTGILTVDILICAVERGGEVFIPNGDFVLQAGDRIHITGNNQAILPFFKSMGRGNLKIKNIMIVGGSRIAFYLSKLMEESGIAVKIIERDPDRCVELAELLPRARIINGDGSDEELLEQEGLEGIDAFVSLTGMDEENLILAVFASAMNAGKVVAKVNRSSYNHIIDRIGIDSVVSPKQNTVNQIVRYVRAVHQTLDSEMLTLYKIVNGKAEAVEFLVGEHTRHLNVPLHRLPLKDHLLLAVIVRGGRVIIPHGETTIQNGDSVVIITNKYHLSDLNDIFND